LLGGDRSLFKETVLLPESPVLVGAHIGSMTDMVGFSRGASYAMTCITLQKQ
jgi:hypothetical protein